MAIMDESTSEATSGCSSASSGICVRCTSHSERSDRKLPAPPRHVTLWGARSSPTYAPSASLYTDGAAKVW